MVDAGKGWAEVAVEGIRQQTRDDFSIPFVRDRQGRRHDPSHCQNDPDKPEQRWAAKKVLLSVQSLCASPLTVGEFSATLLAHSANHDAKKGRKLHRLPFAECSPTNF